MTCERLQRLLPFFIFFYRGTIHKMVLRRVGSGGNQP